MSMRQIAERISSGEHPSLIFSYADFKKVPTEELKFGTLVTGVRPHRLFASQDWIDANKTVRAINSEERDAILEVPAYISAIHNKRTGRLQRVLVLGDSHHRVLREWSAGKRVNVRIIGEKPVGNHLEFSVLRQKAGDPFRNIT